MCFGVSDSGKCCRCPSECRCGLASEASLKCPCRDHVGYQLAAFGVSFFFFGGGGGEEGTGPVNQVVRRDKPDGVTNCQSDPTSFLRQKHFFCVCVCRCFFAWFAVLRMSDLPNNTHNTCVLFVCLCWVVVPTSHFAPISLPKSRRETSRGKKKKKPTPSRGDVGSPIRQQLVRYAELLPKLWNQADPNTMCPPWYKDARRGSLCFH